MRMRELQRTRCTLRILLVMSRGKRFESARRLSFLPIDKPNTQEVRSLCAIAVASLHHLYITGTDLPNSRSKNTIMPRPPTHTHEVNQANTSPAGSDRDGASKA